MVRKRHDRLEGWFREFRAPLRRFLRSKIGITPADLDDVAQEVFLRLLRFDRDELIAQPKAYLFKMGANVASEWSMRARRRLPHSSDWLPSLSTELEFEEDIQTAERDSEVARAINQLSPRTRIMLQLHFRDGLSYEAIAGRLQVTHRVVKREIIRGYAQLRVALSGKTGAPADDSQCTASSGRRR
jgi:RNA polymerase sigma-70 factor (ECF subfamily)